MRNGQRHSDSRGVWRSSSGGTGHLDFQNEEEGSSLASVFRCTAKRVSSSPQHHEDLGSIQSSATESAGVRKTAVMGSPPYAAARRRRRRKKEDRPALP